MSAGIALTRGGSVYYWPSPSYNNLEMPVGVFLGDDDNSAGSTYGLDGFTTSGRVTDVAGGEFDSGYQHWCAVIEHTKLECWGANDQGQLGDGSATSSWTQPVAVTGLPAGNITSISVGRRTTCVVVDGRDAHQAKRANSTAWCWGYNIYGGLGDGTQTNRYTPVQVTNLADNVTQVSGGYHYTCALLAQGSVKCWGQGNYGQRGDGSTVTTQKTPVSVSGLEDVTITQISCEYEHSLAVTSTGKVYAWGRNQYYQLGDQTTDTRSNAVEVTTISDKYNINFVSAGVSSSCASTGDGASMCWGYGPYGELGTGEATSASSTVYLLPGYEG
jgi:alpha-tubulin suppressor-like RCC1 family protein